MNKIACLVITYNRQKLVKRCLQAVYQQSYKEFDIVVVDNGSTDETTSVLLEEKRLFEAENSNSKFIIITIEKNNGPCDAFYEGKKYIFESGYDWAWIMDDDGYADKNQLKNLLVGASETNSYFLNALVLDEKNHENLTFSLTVYEDGKKIIRRSRKDNTEKYVKNTINPYNGTFIHRKVYETCGNMRKIMVIHCIEDEYEARAKFFGFECYTVVNAIHYHPVKESRCIPVLKGVINITIPNYNLMNETQMMYMVRNRAIVKNLYPIPRDFGSHKDLLYFTLHFKFGQMLKWIKYYRLGMKMASNIKKENKIAIR